MLLGEKMGNGGGPQRRGTRSVTAAIDGGGLSEASVLCPCRRCVIALALLASPPK